MLTLHKQAGRSQLYRQSMPFKYVEDLGCLCVFDPEIISAVFRSDGFDVIDFAGQYRYITDHTSLDFTATAVAFDHVPLAQEGPRHKKLRAEMAAIVADPTREKTREVEEFTAAHVARLFVPGHSIELVDDLADPLFVQLFSLWLGVDHTAFSKESHVSQAFDMKVSLGRRAAVNRDVEKLTCAFAAQSGALATSPEMATAMNVLGNDTLKGSIALSLWEIVARNPGKRLNEIDYPVNYPSTGVPFIERVARDDIEIAGMAVTKGQRVRLMLDATAQHVSGEEADLLFGRGRHLCLGKPMALAIWRQLTATLATLPLRCTAGELKMRSGDYAFNYPQHARLSIDD